MSLSEQQNLDIIFHNVQPDYRKKDFTSLGEFFQLSNDVESIHTAPKNQVEHYHMLLKGVTKIARYQISTPTLLWEEDKLKEIVLMEGQPEDAIIDTRATGSL